MAGKKADKTPKKGDNLLQLTPEEQKIILAQAKKHKKLADEKDAVQAGWREIDRGITGALKEIGVSRTAFNGEVSLWMAKENADTPEEEKKAAQKEIVYRDECRKVHAALNVDGPQLDIFNVAAEAIVAREELAKAEEQAEEGTEKPL